MAAWTRTSQLSARRGLLAFASPRAQYSAQVVAQQGVDIKELALNHDAVRHLAAKFHAQDAGPTLFNIAGVTFEGRQEAVSQLQRSQPVLLLPETNQYDPKAVAVQTLMGEQLGYVPRSDNDKFVHGTYTARVRSAGQAIGEDKAPGPWGAVVLAWPFTPSLLPIPLPSTYPTSAAARRVQELCKPGSAEHTAAMKAAGGVCEFTAMSGDQAGAGPLTAAPLWVLDRPAQVVRLKRLLITVQPLADALSMLTQPPNSPGFQTGALLVRAFNRWDEAQLQEYLTWAQGLTAHMTAQKWKVEVP